jgi:hypothetical protein
MKFNIVIILALFLLIAFICTFVNYYEPFQDATSLESTTTMNTTLTQMPTQNEFEDKEDKEDTTINSNNQLNNKINETNQNTNNNVNNATPSGNNANTNVNNATPSENNMTPAPTLPLDLPETIELNDNNDNSLANLITPAPTNLTPTTPAPTLPLDLPETIELNNDNSLANLITPSPTNLTPAPPSLHTPSPNEMIKRGLYSKNGFIPQNISQIGGTGPNNYFIPNIMIRKKQQEPRLFPNGNFEYSLDFEGDFSFPNYEGDNYYNSGYNIDPSKFRKNDRDPWDSVDINAQQSYLQEMRQKGTCTSCLDENQSYYPPRDNTDIYGNQSTSQTTTNTNTSTNTSTGRTRTRTSNDRITRNRPYYDVANFTHGDNMKQFYDGYQIQDPKCWDVPQRRPPVCLGGASNLPAAVFDRGTPLNALELNTSIGSILPNFTYSESPRS